MKRFLIDVNVVLDVLLDRRPHAAASADVWAAIEEGRVDGLLSAHAVTTIHFLNSRAVGPKVARETTDAILSVFGVAAVDDGVVRAANALGWKDFEDAVTAASAERAKCAAIVTRNPRDFDGASVDVLTPVEAAAILAVSSRG